MTRAPATVSGPSPTPGESRLRHWGRLLLLPLAILVLVPIGLTELHLVTIHDLVGAAIPDTIFLEHAAQGLVQGHQPYGPGFLTVPDSQLTFVYPPLSLVLALPPLLAGRYYSFALAVELLALAGVGLWLLHRACRRAGIGFPVALAAALLMIALGPVLVTRVDGLQGLVLAGAALALRGRRLTLAVALVTLAVLVKETVVVAVPPVLLWALWPEPGQRWRERLGPRLRAVAVGLLPAVLLLLGFVAWSGGRVLHAAFASLNRGLEIESVPATLAELLRPLFPVHSFVGRLASEQLLGRDVGWLALLALALGAVALVWGSVRLAREGRRPATAIAFAMAVGLAATPVLSPQYLLALMPVLALAAGSELGRRRGTLVLLVALVMALVTQAEFPYLFASVVSLSPLGTALIAARNLLLVAIAVNLIRPERDLSPAPAPGASPAPL